MGITGIGSRCGGRKSCIQGMKETEMQADNKVLWKRKQIREREGELEGECVVSETAMRPLRAGIDKGPDRLLSRHRQLESIRRRSMNRIRRCSLQNRHSQS